MLRLPELDHCFDRFNFILHYQSGNGHLYARSSEFNSVFNGQTVESGASPDWRFANDRNFVLVTILAAILATPFAIGVAIFMTEYAPRKGTKALRAVIELLVGIPSVVYGYIGLMVVVPLVRKLIGGTGFGILAGTLVLFVMILPTVISLTADSLKAIPVSYRQAALALGATKWQSIYKIVLRAALPGILTAIIFGMTRAFGEALAVQMVIGNAVLMPEGLGTPTATLTSQLTSQMGNTVLGTVSNNALWSLALVLLLMSLVFNLLIRVITRKGAIK